jgi:hypothetical protein
MRIDHLVRRLPRVACYWGGLSLRATLVGIEAILARGGRSV